ncbi:hypothetical protein C8A01DRAFT_16738 [Parachaetomium inaequale]|uniref:Pt repeat family protein n=1 Tax=Parachaetomium inaequale TaxID=2588326 RepID=A0AAN6PEN8_9PEZI|nr:hypothetical protein C8A01DRAFT_16738 [Parachaetomium inaequale]
MGDAFPRLEPTHIDNNKHIDMERERAFLSPVFEEQLGPPTTPALVVHVDIRFTDPVIRSRYCRSYGSSPGFEATNRICRGLVRRIERCSEEFITRKDSGALEVFKGDTYERKPQRFEMTFRVIRRGKGEWAERTYRSYQKQPLTVAHTKEVTLAVHRMIGLFLRRHDENFQWLDCPASETDSEGSETIAPSRDGPLSILSVPRSRFIEATQSFEFVPGYNIELYFRNRNPQRQLPTFERRIRVTSAQTTPLTLFMSEDMLWKALQFANQGLDSKKREFDEHLRDRRAPDPAHPEDDTLELSLRVSNNLGPAYSHVQRNIKSKLALFRDPAARDCDMFLCDMEKYLSHIRNEADAMLNGMNDLELRVVELKGVGWTLREPAKFTLGPSASYGRRTIQAALDRIQTGIGDVIRGHNIAIHVNAHKRGHLVLDKAIVAHERRGKPQETFSTHEDAQTAIVARLKARIQKDMDKVFEDSCSIDDIPEDEDDYFAARPVTPQQPEQAVFEGPSPRYSPSSVRSSPAKRPALGSLQSSPRPRAQRVFSLSRRSMESVRSIDYLKAAREPLLNDSSRPTSAVSEQVSEPRGVGSPVPVPEARGPLLAAAEVRPARSFSLVSRRPSSTIRVSNASTLVEEQTVGASNSDVQNVETAEEQQCSEESPAVGSMTSSEASPAAVLSGTLPVEATPAASLALNPAVQELEVPLRDGDCSDAPATIGQKKQGKMDTPETFVDAREYAASPASEAIIKSELSGALTGVASPREDDEFSTAPSTPELSTGASSPRHSVLITPVYLRTNSDTKDPALRKLYPAPEPEDAAVDLQSECTPEPDSKDDRDRDLDRLTTEPPIDQRPSTPSTTEPNTAAAEAPEDVPGDANNQRVSEYPDPAARVVSRDQTPDNNTNIPPPHPSTASPLFEEDPDTNSQTAPENQVYTALGAEPPTAGSDTAPDSGVGESGVRRSGPSDVNPVHASGPPPASSAVEAGLDPADRLESASSSTSPFGSAGYSVVEDRADRDGSVDDAAVLLPLLLAGGGPEGGCGAEAAAAGPVGGEVVAEGGRVGTEGLVEAAGQRGDVDMGQGSSTKGDAGSEVDGVEGLIGGEGGGDGTGLVVDERGREESASRELSLDNVGPVEEADGVSSASLSDAPGTEVVAKVDLAKSDGPGSDADAQVETDNTAGAVDRGVVPEEEEQATAPELGSEMSPDGKGVAFVSDKGSEPHPDAGGGNDDDHQGKPLGPDGGIDETGAVPDGSRKLDIDVCPEPGTPGPESDKHIASAISLDDLAPGSGALGPSTEAKPDSSVAITTEPPVSETPTPKPAPATPQPEKKENPHLAPIPDLSKLPNLSSSAASFTSVNTTRNSVDTIRPSIDSHRHHPTLPTLEHPHTTSNGSNGNGNSNRPQTAGYLGIGLLGKESRFVEVGLRGALGDVKARRRMSLPLQHLLNKDREVWPGAPASEAGGTGSSSKLRKGRLKGGHEGGGHDDGQSVLPRMMMLLAGAVAIGKIMKQVSE